MATIIVPGYGGSDADHWQSRWQDADASFARIAPSSWGEPRYDDWAAALDRAVGDEPALLVAHSLGCLLSVRWASENPARVAGLFLVAPPDPVAASFPEPAATFRDGLDVRVPVPALVVSSDDDPYATPERTAELASRWGAARVSIGRRGHINAASGLGDWREGANLATAFRAGLGRR